ncbi:MAG: M15 family metallopeptidase [Treponema sp.]|jgi:hypothetical protein|nr:M15 family metallopeptidase [Treponema sp.]
MKALAAAYPDRIDRAEFRGGDWAVLLDGAWYFYAESKLLPEDILPQAADYSPQPFYNYQKELPAWKTPTPEEAERFRSMAENRSRNPLKRSSHFFDALWRARDHNESSRNVKTIRFLEKTVNVHKGIQEKLTLVEERINKLAKTNPEVKSWVNGISTLSAWNWRNIAGVQSRSFHAYGIAVDILPKSYGGKETYWLWASQKKPEWWNVTYNGRYHPPAPVIKAFESCGFVWGGKWVFFDTMHFEYRPEIMILSGMKLETSR